ncbi:uncharacterized protein LOC122259120 [Penaeus japonicus]|uniref:uncharacterized protein LOC122259120 n=1 Tax=Penaeus japonicus TaxID=27405 RepID=UPI001C70EDC4|nr:uncharacterized protein LOC122259120 [Penaeus japonicus]XP_042881619.1 uncharacterized protein LOC122259120 [Penaeus japonicus]
MPATLIIRALVLGLMQATGCVLTGLVTIQHFARGRESILYGWITLSIFCVAGWIANWFNYMRHEVRRQTQRSKMQKLGRLMLNLIPGSSTFSWYLEWFISPNSWSAGYWVSVLQLFQCTLGDIPQAILQTYLIIHFWWDENVATWESVTLMTMSSWSVLLAATATCNYIRNEHFEEEHQFPRKGIFLLVIFATILHLSGRVLSSSIVGKVYSVRWMTGGIGLILTLNYVISVCALTKGFRAEMSCTYKIFSPVPVAFLNAVCMTKNRGLMVMNSFFWMALSLPQLGIYNEKAMHWVLWGLPFLAQCVALLVFLWNWRVIEIAFRRFERLLKRGISILGGKMRREKD